MRYLAFEDMAFSDNERRANFILKMQSTLLMTVIQRVKEGIITSACIAFLDSFYSTLSLPPSKTIYLASRSMPQPFLKTLNSSSTARRSKDDLNQIHSFVFNLFSYCEAPSCNKIEK